VSAVVRHTGANYRPAPKGVPHLAAAVRLPEAPTEYDWHAACDWGTPPANALNNDSSGNCVEVAALQRLRMLTSNIWGRDSWTPTGALAWSLYTANTDPPFNPDDPSTDNGTDTAQFMAWCATRGIRLNEQFEDVVFWCTIGSVAEAPAAIAFTGPVQITLNLPAAAEDLANWGKTPGTSADWKAGSLGGHRVVSGKYRLDGTTPILTAVTWGEEQEMHPDFLSAYLLGMDAALSRTILEPVGLTPAGLDWDAAMATMHRL